MPGLVVAEEEAPDERTGVASLAATNRERPKRFVEALRKLDVPSSHVFRYYDGLLYLMSLMHVSGRFQIILPAR